MKVLLVAVNSKFVHTNLAVRYIDKACEDIAEIKILEKSINTDRNMVLRMIHQQKPDLVCFSCYIWNIDYVLEVAENFKKINPHVPVLLGGPEVSFDSENIMDENPFVDFIASGEGEETMRELLEKFNRKEAYDDIDGITFRREGRIIKNRQRELIADMDSIKSPYSKIDEEEYRDKIIYYESSRGCPFNCQYCMSSTIRGVRNFSIERVKKELKGFIDCNVKQVKFVDRTFNANVSRTLDIISFIKENDNGRTNFHFEVAAHIMDERLVRALSDSRRGLFQIEIGVQSTNPDTLSEICRSQDVERIRNVVEKVGANGNVHQHVDLIAGLPYEGYERFKESFDEVFSMKADHVQLGFLKLLKGAPIRENQIEKHGYEFSSKPPYEVLKNKYIDFSELLRLKDVEEILELYWNSHAFSKSCEYVIQNHYSDSPFGFFEDFSSYWAGRGYFEIGNSRKALYRIFAEFYEESGFGRMELFRELLRYDYLAFAKAGSVPEFLGKYEVDDFKGRCYDFVDDKRNVQKYMPVYNEVGAKAILRKIKIEAFSFDMESQLEDITMDPVKKDSFVLYVYEDVAGLMEKSNDYFIKI